MCTNLDTAGCNWVVATSGTLCRSCSLTRTRPADGDPEMPAFVAAERAKRRLVVELVELGLPITDRRADPRLGTDLRPALQPPDRRHHRPRLGRDHAGPGRGRRRPPRAAAHLHGRALPHPARALPARDRPLLLRGARRERRCAAGVPDPLRRPGRGLPVRPRPALLGGRSGRVGVGVRVLLRDDAPGRGLGRDLRPLPAHPRHRRHRSRVRVRARRRRRRPAR